MKTAYKISLKAEPKSRIYKDLIDYAIDKSDAVMLIARYDFTAISDFQPANAEIFENQKQYLEYLNAVKRMENEAIENARIFKKLQPYLIKQRHKSTEWPSTKILYDGNDSLIDINVYKVCDGIKEFIYEPNALYSWRYPCFPEDLSFFKEGFCWFKVCAHEEFAFIYLDDVKEVQALKKISLNFTVTEHKINDSILFYENYSNQILTI